MVCWSKTGQQRHGGLFRSMAKQGGALIGTRLGDGQTEDQHRLAFENLCTRGCLASFSICQCESLDAPLYWLLGCVLNLPRNPTMVSSADRSWKG